MRKAMLATVMLLGGLGTNSLAADFDGDSRADIGTFRGSDFLWNIRGITLFFFGNATDILVPGDYNGDGKDEGAIYRPVNGLWAVRDVTREYFGGPGEIPISGGSGGLKTYDYVVRPGNASDLRRALESNVYHSVFIPSALYDVSGTITVDNVKHIVGETNCGTRIRFASNHYLRVYQTNHYCHIENISFEHENANPFSGSLVVVDGSSAMVENCRFEGNSNVNNGLEQGITGRWLQVLNCYAELCNCGFLGYAGAEESLFANCRIYHCGTGFSDCQSLSNCYVDGGQAPAVGYYECNNLVGCRASMVAVGTQPAGFHSCNQLSACTAECATLSPYTGFLLCSYLSSCKAKNATWGFQTCSYISSSRTISCSNNWPGCTYRDTGSCSP